MSSHLAGMVGRELYGWPKATFLDSKLDVKAIGVFLGHSQFVPKT